MAMNQKKSPISLIFWLFLCLLLTGMPNYAVYSQDNSEIPPTQPSLPASESVNAATTSPSLNLKINFGLLLTSGVFVVIGLSFYLRSRQQVPAKKASSSASSSAIHSEDFTTVTVDEMGQIIEKRNLSCQYFRENLGGEITLDLVYINGGLFNIGSRSQEGDEREKPRHEVIVKAFLMSKYPITQAQWQAIATLPKIRRYIEPEPAKFKGEHLPVENVSWYDAVEFCQRLSILTGREYRLPSEAEWEYACRGKTKTPFYFGPTITSNLANYKGIFTYAKERKSEDRHITTPVGQFPPNDFGLYDLHGNVSEWCADTWHDNYQDAPADGSAWIKNKNEEYRVCSPVRGGAWIASPQDCRSASRKAEKRDRTNAYTGFRVVCEMGNLKFS